jgi:cell division protein FtsB
LLREIKNRLRATLAPMLFLGITWYFAWNAMHGTRGLEAQHLQEAELGKARAAFASIDAARSEWETRIATLNGQSIAGDMLDHEARVVLNLANPADLIVELPPSGPTNN